MRILHVFDHSLPLHSGYTFRSHSILVEQRKRGWETVHLTTPRHRLPGPDPETADGLVFHRTRPATGWRARLPLLSILAEIRATATRLEELAREHRPDVLHAHSPALNAMASIRAGRRLRLPVVYEIRGTWEDAGVANLTQTEGGLRYRLTRALETHSVRRADAVCVICEGLRKEFLARGCPPEKLTVIPNGVDPDIFVPLQARDAELEERLGLSGAEVIGFLGSFYDYEGLDTLLDAVALLAESRPAVRLLLVGGGPREAAIQEQVKRLGLQRRVLIVGRVPHEDVRRYYSLVDILAYPRKRTRVTELVTPLKPLEAMAQGKLVVASDVGGHKEMIAPGSTGELFRAGDSRALMQSLDRMLAHRDSWPTYHTNGLEYVRKMRTWVRSVDGYAPVYERLASRGRNLSSS